MTPMPICHERLTCRLCGRSALLPALTLPPTPPANAFQDTPTAQECFPLEVKVCRACGHSQLGHVVDAKTLFADYVYVSGTSPVFRKHFEDYATNVKCRANLTSSDLVVEIGSNDGTLLRNFTPSRVMGIEPAVKIAQAANEAGVKTLNEFFNAALALGILDEHGPAKLIVANNVLAHIDNLRSVFEGVADLLDKDGLFVFEVQYVGDLLRDGLVDNVYHEHLDFHAVTPLLQFLAQFKLRLVDVEHVPTHGGSIRCFVKHAHHWVPMGNSVAEFLKREYEEAVLTIGPWIRLGERIAERKKELHSLLLPLKQEGREIVGYGAPAKATTFLYTFGLGADVLDYIVDDSPWKQGHYSPGLHIPILAPGVLYEEDTGYPDYVIINAWNFASSIIAKHAPNLPGTHWITPLPKLEVTP